MRERKVEKQFKIVFTCPTLMGPGGGGLGPATGAAQIDGESQGIQPS